MKKYCKYFFKKLTNVMLTFMWEGNRFFVMGRYTCLSPMRTALQPG